MKWYHWKLAFKETRGSRGKLLFAVFSVAVGVASLSAVRTAVSGIEQSIAKQARELAGADMMLRSNKPLDSDEPVTSDLTSRGAAYADTAQFFSMLRAESAGEEKKASTLVQVRAVSEGFPFYSAVKSSPAHAYSEVFSSDSVLIDPKIQSRFESDLNTESLSTSRFYLGDLPLSLAGTFVKEPGTPVAATGFAPVVYVNYESLERTNLISQGSRVRYIRYFKLPESVSVDELKDEYFRTASENNIEILSYAESAESLQRFLGILSNFLAIVGLITLLLGGLGIGSSMNVFLKDRLDHAAILRSLGSTPKDIFKIYFALAVILGLAGSLPGLLGGFILPAYSDRLVALAGQNIPVSLEFPVSVRSLAEGFIAGMLVTLLAAFLPVFRMRRVPVLRVLKKENTSADTGDRIVYLITALLTVFAILGLTYTQTDSLPASLAFAGISVAVAVILWLFSGLVTAAVKFLAPKVSDYGLKQALANFYRPGNQTASIILSVGTGVFLLTSLYIVRSSILEEVSVESREDLPNIFVIDIQPEQKEQFEELIQSESAIDSYTLAPMIASRIDSINGRPVDRSGIERDARRRSFDDRMRTREYFVTYRSHTVASEEVTEGEFWTGIPEKQQVSVDEDWADRMDVSLGDTITLDIQGILLNAEVTSMRSIRWQAMQPNSFLVFSPGRIENAPKYFIASFRVNDPDRLSGFQQDLVERLANVTVIDITEAVENARLIIGKISLIVEFLSAVAILNGLVILAGAVAAGRYQRLKEAMLLKVLGADKALIRKILIYEYSLLAFTGLSAGIVLAVIAAGPVMAIGFETTPEIPFLSMLIPGLLVIVLSLITGLTGSRDVIRSRPVDILREAG